MHSIWFGIDFISSLPLHWFAGREVANQTGLLKSIKMIRLLRVGKLLKRMDDILRASAYRFARLFGFIFIVIHWVACMYHFMGERYANLDWDEVRVDNDSWLVMLIWAPRTSNDGIVKPWRPRSIFCTPTICPQAWWNSICLRLSSPS